MKLLFKIYLFILLSSTLLSASVITFNSSNSTFTENGHNFTVSGNGYIWTTDYRSASYCAGNNTSYGTIIITKTSGNNFQLNNLWLKGAWAGFQVKVEGFDGSTLKYSTGTISISTSYAQTNVSSWTGVNKIIITGISNGFFVVDDIDYTLENTAPTDITVSSSSVSDGDPSGTTVGSFSTTDADDTGGHTYTFASDGTDNTSFTISGSDLVTAFAADYATKNSYAIKIRSTDSQGLYYEKDFTITVNPAAIIWNGSSTTFTKADYADYTLEANQDRITNTIWITRKSSQGIFNIYSESAYNDGVSPSGTEWADGTTADYSTLTYQDWVSWHIWNPPSKVGVDAVLHLIDANIYIDIKFTSWTEGGAGGGFSYIRSTDPALPVELKSFTAKVSNNAVELNWKTATEVNNYGFAVERCEKSSGEWSQIGFIEGAGNSNSPQNYSFIDIIKLSGTVQYRLKQIDINGAFEYSNIVEATFALPLKFVVDQNYPNPFNPSTTIEFAIPENNTVLVKVFNVLGMEVKEILNEYKTAGNHKIEFNAGGLSSGIYYYQVSSGNYSVMKKMILLK